MPHAITHQLIAEEARDRLPSDLKKLLKNSPDEFFLGAQGPDVFFFYRIGCKSEYNLGKYLHRYRIFDVLSFFHDALSPEKPPRFSQDSEEKAKSYILGYLTHYASDSVFHPFVYRYLETYRCPKRTHQQIENDWDVYFLRERKNLSVENYRFPLSVEEIVKDGSIARLYGCLARFLGREEIEKRKFDAGVKHFAEYLSFFHGKCFRAQKFWSGTEKFFHLKPFLGALFPRENQETSFLFGEDFLSLSEGKGKSADELFEAAVLKSVRLIPLFLEAAENGTPLNKEEFSDGFLTGKPVES